MSASAHLALGVIVDSFDLASEKLGHLKPLFIGELHALAMASKCQSKFLVVVSAALDSYMTFAATASVYCNNRGFRQIGGLRWHGMIFGTR